MVADRTPVKERIIKLNKKAKSCPGKFPGRKQAMVSEYFKSKSPKAKEARDQRKKEPETQNKTLRGLAIVPCWVRLVNQGTNKNTYGPGPRF